MKWKAQGVFILITWTGKITYKFLDKYSMSNDNLDFVKTKIKDAALTSFRDYNSNPPRNLLDEEFETLQNFSKIISLVKQKTDKGSSVVILDKDVYIKSFGTGVPTI